MLPSLRTIKRLGVIAGLVAGFGCAGANAQQAVKLRVATISPPGSFFSDKVLIPFLERVKADSAGTFDYQVYPSGTLGRNPSEQIKIVADGIADISFSIPAYTPGQLDDYSVSELPGLARTSTEASLGIWNAYKAGLLGDIPGVKPLGVFATAPNALHFAKPIASLADLNGQKIRAAGRVQTELLEALGATPVGNLRAPEVAEALSRGVINGTLMDWLAIKDYRVERIAKAHIDTPVGMVALMLPINAKVYDALPAAAKAALDKHSGEALVRAAGLAFDRENTALRETLRAEKGRQIVTPDDAAFSGLKPRFAQIVAAWREANPRRPAIMAAFEAGIASAKP